jgi:hypothetical protein
VSRLKAEVYETSRKARIKPFKRLKKAKVSRRQPDNDCEGVRIDGLKGGEKDPIHLRRNPNLKNNRTPTWQECQNNKTRKGEHRLWLCNPSL